MNEQELQKRVDEISDNVHMINRRVGGTGTVLWRGIVSGFGYVIGAFVAIAIIGWLLNAVGVIPSLENQVESLKNTLQQAQNRQIPGTK
jgi:hypothetical protein